MDWPGRLHRAMELLDKAHQDIAREEDNKFAQGLQEGAFAHTDAATRGTPSHSDCESAGVIRSKVKR